MSRRPLFHILAGPNGAGKSTLYANEIKPRFPNTEFINADLLAQEYYGHPAVTREESEVGQLIAEARRRDLMVHGRNIATESTFSHPSKLDLVRDAKAAGYDVRLYHVNVHSADLSVKRVQRRVGEGGHPVPEDKTRERYERNQPLIHEAAKIADRAYVFDNSEFGKPHRRVLELVNGHAVDVSHQMPQWAQQLYADELQAYPPQRLNRPASSFAQAQQMTRALLGPQARTVIVDSHPGQGSVYSGKIIAQTDLHIVQAVSSKTAVAHFKSRLDRAPVVGEDNEIVYTSQGNARVTLRGGRQGGGQVTESDRGPEQRNDQAAAMALLGQPPAQAMRDHPRLAGAYATLGACEAVLRKQGMTQEQSDQVLEQMRQALSREVMAGRYPAIKTEPGQ